MLTSTIRPFARRVRDRIRPDIPKRRKYEAELRYWTEQLAYMLRWYRGDEPDWHGLPSPTPEQRASVSDLDTVNAVMTSHVLRPVYVRRLMLSLDHFVGQRVLEVGSGPLSPVMQFADCERHGLDPLNDLYLRSGWPLYAYPVVSTTAYAERMPYPDAWFDAAISLNALDHVDDFHAVAAEIQRVLKPGGAMHIEVEYHKATVTEPLELKDTIVRAAFGAMHLECVANRGKKDAWEAGGTFSPHATNDERIVLWRGMRR